MKKKILIIGAVIFFVVVIIGAYSAFNAIFPKANSIDCPSIESVASISVACSDNDAVLLNDADFAEVLSGINGVIPTRNQSLNDYPTLRPYYIIEIKTSANVYRYFVWEENSQVYIEKPYEGIYKADRKMLDLVLSYLAE